ncbi:hypothetical protein [Bdellovibrio sp. NC01]|uniref:hypothetical protein n=1 Tax=Bdellovibrio sp. NC01 TaxID=2220073 RepID=UPI001FEFFFC6|nr:hypothetical protein [Bdellovibrio sp. NC01]
MLKGFLTFILLFTAQAAMGQQLYETARSIRSLGMGGMYIPVVNDVDALFYNPAALAKQKGFNFLLADVALGINSDAISDIDTYKDFDPNDPTSYDSLFGKRLYAQGMGKAGFTMPYFGVGYYTNYDVSLELHNPAYPQFKTYFLNDSAFVLGGAVPITENFSVGMNLKRITRWGGEEKDLGLSTIANGTSFDEIGKNFDNKGVGYGIDLALEATLPTPFSPTFALVWQDAGGTAFTKTSGTDAPPMIPQNLSAGFGLGFDLPGIDWTAGIEARHLTDSDVQLGKKIHLGTELSLPLIDVRAGISQGYLSYGVGVNFLIFHLDAVSYTEELGVYPGQTAENRYAVSLSIDLSFDAAFKFTDNDGKRRKLKQRR